MITQLFDTLFTRDGNMQAYVDNVMVSTSIILFCIYISPFGFHIMSLTYLQGLYSKICHYQTNIYDQKSHTGISRQKICEAKSQQQDFMLIGTDVALSVTNSTLCLYGALIYGSVQMKVLVYTQYGKNICSFPPPWMGRPQYLDQNNQRINPIQLF